MADGSCPDQTQALLQWQASLNAAAGNGAKGIPLLAGILPCGAKDIDITAGTTLKGKGIINADGMINKVPQGRPGLLASLRQQMGITGGQIFDDIKKAGQNAGVMYSGDLPSGSMPGSSNAPSAGGDIQIG